MYMHCSKKQKHYSLSIEGGIRPKPLDNLSTSIPSAQYKGSFLYFSHYEQNLVMSGVNKSIYSWKLYSQNFNEDKYHNSF